MRLLLSKKSSVSGDQEMDPLSITVSALTLMTMAVTTIQGLEKLRRALGAQDKLLELLNEVSFAFLSISVLERASAINAFVRD